MSALIAYSLVLLMGVIIVGAVKRSPQTSLGKPLLSAYNVMLGLFAIYLFLPAMMLLVFQGGEYVWLPAYGGYRNIALTAFVGLAALLSFLGAYWLRQRASPKVVELDIFRRPEPVAVLLAWTMIGIGVSMKLYTLYAGGGIEMSAIRLSTGIRDNLRVEDLPAAFVALRYLSGIADASAMWLLAYQFRQKRIDPLIVIVFLIVVGISFFGTGKRLFLLWPVLTLALGIHYYIRPLRVNLAPTAIFLVIIGGFASLMFRIYLPAYSAGYEIDLYRVSWAGGSIISFYFFSLEFATFELLTLSIENSDSVIRLFGDSVNAFYITNIQPLSYFVPRIFWPGKPEIMIDLSHAYRVFVLGGDLTSAGGVASTLVGTSWTFGGPIGVAIAMLALGYAAAGMDGNRSVRGRLSPMGTIWYAFGIVAVFHMFRQGTIGWVAMIVVFQQLGVMIALGVLALIDRAPKSTRRSVAARKS